MTVTSQVPAWNGQVGDLEGSTGLILPPSPGSPLHFEYFHSLSCQMLALVFKYPRPCLVYGKRKLNLFDAGTKIRINNLIHICKSSPYHEC